MHSPSHLHAHILHHNAKIIQLKNAPLAHTTTAFMPKSRDELKGAVDDCFCSTGPLGSGKAKDRSLKEISPTESSVKSLVVFPELRKDYATLQAINAQIVGGKLHGLGLDTKHPLVDVKAQSKNYLIAVLHKAFTAHLPITLCPDDIWLTILQGLAIHVNANADSLKASILKDPNKKDKQELLVRDDSLRANDINNDWSHVFGSFTSQIEEHTVKGVCVCVCVWCCAVCRV